MLRHLRAAAVPLLLLAAAGCENDLLPGPVRDQNGIEYVATSEVAGSGRLYINTTVTLKNPTDAERTVSFPDGCVVQVRAYATPGRGGTPVADTERSTGCTLAFVSVTVPALGTATLTRQVDVLSQFGKAPAGHYYLSAVLRPGPRIEVPAGEADLPPT